MGSPLLNERKNGDSSLMKKYPRAAGASRCKCIGSNRSTSGSDPGLGPPSGQGVCSSGGLDQMALGKPVTRTPSPTKSKLNFLEGFKSTLRTRSPIRNISNLIVPGARLILTASWGKLRAGDAVIVTRVDGPGLLVRFPNNKEEFRIPASVFPHLEATRAFQQCHVGSTSGSNSAGALVNSTSNLYPTETVSSPYQTGNVTVVSPWTELDATSSGWEAEQFAGRYMELEVLGAGRFAKVRRATDRGTGQEIALKQTCRQRQPYSLTRAEYELLTNTRHRNIIRAYALFENAPRPGVDTIVLELVKGSLTLVAYLIEKSEYTEASVAKYTGQLLSALEWLHSRQKAHLDLRPENVLMDRDTESVKLIDLGEAVRVGPMDEVVPPADLEFAAPESVLGRPTAPYTDMWSAGVFLYVLLSGLSPFLDDSVEETTANILKCDFCFPGEYFKDISNDAKDLLGRLLCLHGEERASAELSLTSPWFRLSTIGARIPSSRMAALIERRTHRSKTLQNRNGSSYS